jgi:hypothetical protein
MELLGFDIFNAALVHHAWRYVAGRNQIADPLRGVGVDLIVKRCHL